MGRRNRGREPGQARTPEPWELERTLADAERDEPAEGGESGEVRCACGSEEFLLEAYLRVLAGAIDPAPVEVETLTCPQCGREYEAIQAEGGRVLRGDFLGQTDLDE